VQALPRPGQGFPARWKPSVANSQRTMARPSLAEGRAKLPRAMEAIPWRIVAEPRGVLALLRRLYDTLLSQLTPLSPAAMLSNPSD